MEHQYRTNIHELLLCALGSYFWFLVQQLIAKSSELLSGIDLSSWKKFWLCNAINLVIQLSLRCSPQSEELEIVYLGNDSL